MSDGRLYFSKAGAQAAVGHRVEALSDFPSVPRGTQGMVVRAARHAGDAWTVLVQWDVKTPSSYILAMVLDASVNFRKRGAPVTDTFSRTEFEALVRVVSQRAHETSRAS